MLKKRNIFSIFIIINILVLIFNNRILALEETNVNNEEIGGFSIEGIPNKNQLDKNSGYFYLKEDPNSSDLIKVKLNNSSKQDKTLSVKIVDANTNINGIVDYTGTIKNSKYLKEPLTSIVDPEKKEVLVPGKSTIETTLKVKMPSRKFKGIILGGVVVSEKTDNEKVKEGSIKNDYSYTIGIAITNENKVELFKNVSVQLEKVSSALSYGRKVIQANILNPNPYIFSKAEVKGAVYNEDGKAKIKENSLNNVSIAPYSVLPFQIDWQKDNLKPGTYIFKGSVKTEENTWDFEKKFEIKNTEAKKINEESVFKVVLPIWFIYSGYFVILINIIGSFYIIIRKVKKQGRK